VEALAMYVRDGEAFVGTELIQGGWDPNAANGGAVLALLGQVLDTVPTLVPMGVSRFTADLVRPVPLGTRLDVHHEVVREGKKIQLVELRMTSGGLDLVRASALRLRKADLGDAPVPADTTDERPAAGLSDPESMPRLLGRGDVPAGFLRAVDMRRTPGKGGTWVRLDTEVVAGEPNSPTARMAFSFDFANLIGLDMQTPSMVMINPDVTAQVLRSPVGEWVAVTGDTRFSGSTGRGVSAATLSDRDGPFAAATTSQLLQPR
jgi:acyl-coenzyme A thioesterase PaaI-like protein